MDYTSGRPAVFFFFDIQLIRDPSTHTVPSHISKKCIDGLCKKKAEDQRRQAICRKNQNAVGDCRDLGIWLELRAMEILLYFKECSMQAEGDIELWKLAFFWNLDPRNTECRKGHSKT